MTVGKLIRELEKLNKFSLVYLGGKSPRPLLGKDIKLYDLSYIEEKDDLHEMKVVVFKKIKKI